MSLVYGEPGLGKTQALLWWATQNDAIFIRAANNMSARWLMQELIEELGEVPYHFSSDLFKQCVRRLNNEPKVIIVDEIDYLTGNESAIETLRDIYDKTNVSIVMAGMGMADKKLLRYRHLYDRISEKLKFEPFSKKDIKTIIEQLSEIEMTECAVKYIFNKTNRFRQIVKLINKAETIAHANGLSTIDEITIKEFVHNDGEETDKAG
ncbi:MAG: ATP-binding protein [bacterium]